MLLSSMPSSRPTRVFVSYTHDSSEHKNQVLTFSRFLVRNRIDVCLDQWFLADRKDWYTWAIKNIEEADFVIAIASERYRQAADGHVTAEDNRGLQAEAAMLRELLHDDRPKWTRRILPVILPGHDEKEIPRFLQPRTADHFRVTAFTVAGAEYLLRVLTGQPPHVKPALGDRTPDLPPRDDPGTPSPQPQPTSAGGTVQTVVSLGGGTTIVNQGGDQNISM